MANWKSGLTVFDPLATAHTSLSTEMPLPGGAVPEVAMARPELARGGLAPWQIKRVVRHIAEHFSRPIAVNELAELVRLSASHFSRSFRASLGISPHALIREQRVSHARRLLVTTTLSLADIAAECGFADQSHFSRRFQQITATSPGRWRRAQLPAPPPDPT